MDPGKLVFLGWIPGRWGFQNGSPQLKNGSLEVLSPLPIYVHRKALLRW
jgi:hypothetical protein